MGYHSFIYTFLNSEVDNYTYVMCEKRLSIKNSIIMYNLLSIPDVETDNSNEDK